MRVLHAMLIVGLCSGIHYYSMAQEQETAPAQVEETEITETETLEVEQAEAEKAAAEKAAADAAAVTPPEETPTPLGEELTEQPPATVLEEDIERTTETEEQPPVVPTDEITPPQEIPEQAPTEGFEVAPQSETPETTVPAFSFPEAPMQEPVAPIQPAPETLTVPEPQAKPEGAEPEIIEIKGIDTLDSNEPKGNWLLKRIWWENAEQAYEKIKQMKQKIIDARMTFFQKRTEFDRAVLDPFYIKVGVGQGELKEILSSLLAQLEQMRTIKGSLNEEEREFLVTLELEQETLNGLNQKLKAVTEVDNAIDDALLKLIEQINRAQEYEYNAWEAFKNITRELSDKRARELYYSLEGNWKNIRAISEYIQNQYTPYFDQLLQRAQALVNEMDAAIQALKEKGVDIKAQAQKMIQQEHIAEEVEEEEEPVVPQQRSGWLAPLYAVWDAIASVFSGIWHFITSFFVSAPKPVEIEEQVEEAVVVEPEPAP